MVPIGQTVKCGSLGHVEKTRPRVFVPKELGDLVPKFLKNRARECALLKSAYQAVDMNAISKIARRMIANGDPYGFLRLTELGKQLDAAVCKPDIERVRVIAVEYREYLATLEIVYSD